MLLFIAIPQLWANPQEVSAEFQKWAAISGESLLVGAFDAKALRLANQAYNLDKTLPLRVKAASSNKPQPAMNKLLKLYNTRCGLFLTVDNAKGWKVTPVGACKPNSRKLSLRKTKTNWRVEDQNKKKMRPMEYAILAGDIPLQKQLRSEQTKSNLVRKGLLVGSGLLTLSAVIPLASMNSGFDSASENKLWSSVFLASSAAILLQATKYPSLSLVSRQSKLSAYRSQAEVEQTIETIWPTKKTPQKPSSPPPKLDKIDLSDDESTELATPALPPKSSKEPSGKNPESAPKEKTDSSSPSTSSEQKEEKPVKPKQSTPSPDAGEKK